MLRRLIVATTVLLAAGAAAQASWYEYYKGLEQATAAQRIDWVQYYKQSGSSVNGPNAGRIHWAPNYLVPPQMQWAVPNGALPGAPAPPPGVWQLPPPHSPY